VEAARAKLARAADCFADFAFVPPVGKLPVYGPPSKAEHDDASLKDAQRLLGQAIAEKQPPSDAILRAALILFNTVTHLTHAWNTDL